MAMVVSSYRYVTAEYIGKYHVLYVSFLIIFATWTKALFQQQQKTQNLKQHSNASMNQMIINTTKKKWRFMKGYEFQGTLYGEEIKYRMHKTLIS